MDIFLMFLFATITCIAAVRLNYLVFVKEVQSFFGPGETLRDIEILVLSIILIYSSVLLGTKII